MAQSLLDKVQTLISANLHSMVDSALQSNSVKVMDEYVRQAERNIEELESATVTVGGSVKTLKRKYDEITKAVEKLDKDIDTLLTSGKTDLAAGAQTELNSKQQLAQEYYQQWQQQDVEYKRMLDARLKLEARLTQIKQEREQVQELMKLVEAKAATNKTIKSLNDLQGIGDDDVRQIADSIRARLDLEETKLEQSSTRLQQQVDEVIEKGTIDAQLEERRKRLGLGGSS